MMGRKNKNQEDPLEYAGPLRKLETIGCLLAAISAVIGVGPFLFIWCGIRDVFYMLTLGETFSVTKWGVLAVSFAIASMLVYFVGLLFCHVTAFRTARNLKMAALKHLTKLPLGFFTTHSSGQLRREIDECAAQTEGYLAHQLADLTAAKTTVVITVIVLFIFDWRLGLLGLVPIGIGLLFMIPMMGPKAMGWMRNYQTALGEMNGNAVEYVRGIPVVKTFQQSVFSFRRFHQSIENYKRWAVAYAKSLRIPMCGYTVSINGTFAFLIPAFVLLAGSVANPQKFLLNFIFYILFTPFVATTFNKILWSSDQNMRAQDAIRRIKKIINEPPLKESERPKTPQEHSISFKKVIFSYPEVEKPALNAISFTVMPGQTLALVGPSGGGKSTIASLIPRFFDATEGEVCIGGVNVKQIRSKELMKQVAFVFQDNHLFKASLLDNVKAANPDATDKQIQAAIDAAMCRDIVEKMPDGLNTMLGTKGVYLSGGEKQRIALARAILKDAPIVVLDEATAFVDPENEWQIRKALEHLTQGKTVIMIAHRLSTVQNADQILVLTDGIIREKGTHDSLLTMDGLYAAMWREYQKSTEWEIRLGVKK